MIMTKQQTHEAKREDEARIWAWALATTHKYIK